MLACDPNAPVDLQAKVVDARPNGRFAQNNAMQRARDDVRRLGWSLCREPLIATVRKAKTITWHAPQSASAHLPE